MKEAIKKTYGKKGEKIVNMNCLAVDAGLENVKEINVLDSWKIWAMKVIMIRKIMF